MRIGDIHDLLRSDGRVPIVISCQSARYLGGRADKGGNDGGDGDGIGANKDISWSEAFCILRRIEALLSESQTAGSLISPADIQSRFNLNEKLGCNS
jgi:hypothetical protein